jgi:hypothetical protein
MILDSCNEDTPQVTPQVKQLISIINGEMRWLTH